MKPLRFCRKGNLADPPVIIVFMLIFSIVILLTYVIADDLNTRINQQIEFQTSRTAMENVRDAILNFDYVFVITVAGLIASTLVSAFFIRSHPIFFAVSSILLFVFMIPTVVVANAFESFKGASKISPVLASFPFVEYFMDNLPWVFVVTMILVLVVLFMYKGGDRGGYYG